MDDYKTKFEIENDNLENNNLLEDIEIYSPFDLDFSISFDLDLDFYYNINNTQNIQYENTNANTNANTNTNTNINANTNTNTNTNANSHNFLNIVYFNENNINNSKTPLIGNIFEEIDNFNFISFTKIYNLRKI